VHLQRRLWCETCQHAGPRRLRSDMSRCPSATIQSHCQLFTTTPKSAVHSPSASPPAGRLEFTEFLPESSQGVVVQPIGKEGVLIVGTDTQRGISRLDQAWVATLADKLEVSLEGYKAPKPGVGFASSKA
jgi:hypothetical protein